VYAFANIRGGGELGDTWHKGGMLDKKQNSFNDFIAAAQYLIDEKYTRPERLAISGASNGGMLVAVAAVQRPDLFRAVVSRAPHLDMIRHHKFFAAAPWVAEFGSPDIKEEFNYLYRWYSPYHNVSDGARYPAMLFVTGDADTRVASLHARKTTARMQAATGSGRQVILRYDSQTGHGGALVQDRIARLTDELAFLLSELGAPAGE
jgi:prolyl oligopeptidase